MLSFWYCRSSEEQNNHARKRSLRRLCFYTCLSVILFTGGGCVVGGMHGRGVHGGGMCGGGGVCVAGACMVRCAWQGGMRGRGHAWQWGMCGRGHACHACPPADTIRYGDMVNEQAVCILLECILVLVKGLPLIGIELRSHDSGVRLL